MSTPSQTVGPYLSIGLPWTDGPDLVPDDTPGAIWLSGTVFDGAGEPVPDGLIEFWQADPSGHFGHADDPGRTTGFRGFARCPTDADGGYAIRTLPPGAIPGQAPHIDVAVFARGLLHRLVTRIYLPGNAEANAADPVLGSVPVDRRDTLLAVSDGEDGAGYRFDVHLQGERETVFFEV